jgi:hypothetical protein
MSDVLCAIGVERDGEALGGSPFAGSRMYYPSRATAIRNAAVLSAPFQGMRTQMPMISFAPGTPVQVGDRCDATGTQYGGHWYIVEPRVYESCVQCVTQPDFAEFAATYGTPIGTSSGSVNGLIEYNQTELAKLIRPDAERPEKQYTLFYFPPDAPVGINTKLNAPDGAAYMVDRPHPQYLRGITVYLAVTAYRLN